MVYKSPEIGQEITCVMKISRELLLDSEKLKSIFNKTLKEHNFSILKTTFYSFEPQGFTAIFLLSESHLAVHTYPEHNSLYFNLYSCRGPDDAEKTFNSVKEKLSPEKILFLKKEKVPVRDID